MFGILRNRDFALLWLGQTISNLGDEVRTWAMSFWVFKASNHSPVMFTLAFIAATLPQLLVGPIAGVLIDRVDRRKAMIYSDLARGLCSLGLIAAAATGQYLYALPLVFLAACAGEFFNPAKSAMIPRAVGKENLVEAGSLSQTTTQILRLAGPGLGTAIYVALGPMVSFIVDGISFFLSAACIAMVRTSGAVAPSTKKLNFWADIKAGLSFIWNQRPIRALFVALAVLFAGAGAINSLGMFIVQAVLHLPESAMAATSTAQSIATLVCAVLMGTLAGRIKRVPLLVPIGVLFAATGIGVIAGAPSFAWLLCGSVLVGVCNSVLNIGFGATAQAYIPDEMMGRVMGVFGALPVAVLLTSSGVAGVLAQTINPRYILGGAAVIFVVGALVAYLGLKDVVLPSKAKKQATAAAAG